MIISGEKEGGEQRNGEGEMHKVLGFEGKD